MQINIVLSCYVVQKIIFLMKGKKMWTAGSCSQWTPWYDCFIYKKNPGVFEEKQFLCQCIKPLVFVIRT